MNKKLDENESAAQKEYAKLLDESMQSIEKSLNNDIISSIRTHDQQIKNLGFLEEKFDNTEKALNRNVDNVNKTLSDHIVVI